MGLIVDIARWSLIIAPRLAYHGIVWWDNIKWIVIDSVLVFLYGGFPVWPWGVLVYDVLLQHSTWKGKLAPWLTRIPQIRSTSKLRIAECFSGWWVTNWEIIELYLFIIETFPSTLQWFFTWVSERQLSITFCHASFLIVKTFLISSCPNLEGGIIDQRLPVKTWYLSPYHAIAMSFWSNHLFKIFSASAPTANPADIKSLHQTTVQNSIGGCSCSGWVKNVSCCRLYS